MSTPFLGLRTCAFKVPDLNQAKTWYSEVFNIEPYFDEPFYVGFNVAGYELGLQPIESETMKKGENVVVYWGVEDAHAAYQRLLELGARPHEAPMDVGGDIVVASVLDPWDNVLGVIYNPHFTLVD